MKEMEMKRISILILIVGLMGLGLMSCTLGTPPECALEFSVGTPNNGGSVKTIPFTLKNTGNVDLKDCKIELAITVNGDLDPGPLIDTDFTAWTTGVDLNVYQATYNGTYYSPYSFDIQTVKIIAAGFANPKDGGDNTFYSVVQ